MEHYKSWAGLNKQLTEMLCDELKNRITYFLTRYRDVHNSYGRAAIRLDGEELVCFSWVEVYHQEHDIYALPEEERERPYEEIALKMKSKWDNNCTYCDMDFLKAILHYRNMPIQKSLQSENNIIKIFAIMDKRVGKRTLLRISAAKNYEKYPTWVKQFYEIRLLKLCNS